MKPIIPYFSHLGRVTALLKNLRNAAWGHAAYENSFEMGRCCRPGALTGRVFQQPVAGFFAILLASAELCTAQSTQTNGVPNLPPPGPWQIVANSLHSRTLQRTTYEVGPGGQVFPRLRTYQEIKTGLNYMSNGVLTQADDQIASTATGASADHAQAPVTFLGNLNSAGAVDLTLPEGDGRHLVSNILGLGYTDIASGQSVLWAPIQNAATAGQILPSGNQALYSGVFSNWNAEIRYDFSVAGLEQFVIIHESPPSPANWGLNPTSTVLQVFTEFLNPPSPAVIPVQSAAGDDNILDFGIMKMGKGEAFAIGSDAHKVPVVKRWVQTPDRRTILVEQVSYESLLPLLQSLPAGSASLNPKTGVEFATASSTQKATKAAKVKAAAKSSLVARNITKNSPLPVLPPRKTTAASTPPMKVASAAGAMKGVALDYTILSSESNFTAQADTTYYVSGLVNIAGTMTCEGGSVLKFDPSASASIVTTNLTWLTSPYRPAVFTAMDDDTVGDSISGSSGSPSGFYGGVALDFSGTPQPGSVTGLVYNARFSYLSNAVSCLFGTTEIQDAQFNFCKSVINNNIDVVVNLENVLCWNCGGFQNIDPCSCSIQVTAQNCTFDNCTNFMSELGYSTLDLTNCILAGVTNWQPTSSYNFVTNTCAVLSSDAGVFQTVGAGSHYLAPNSPYRNVGTTNIDPLLLADLANKTTYPPVVYSNTSISVPTTFYPQASRDAGQNSTLDIGYHYDALDWVFGGVSDNANLTFTAGTAIGWFELPGSGGPGYGLALNNNVTNIFSGTATAPCVLARYDSVQESCNGAWQDKGWLAAIASFNSNASDPPQVSADFLHCAALAGDPNHFRDYDNPMNLWATNSELWGGSAGGYGDSCYFQNCLFGGVYLGLTCDCSPSLTLLDCTMHYGTLLIQHWSGATWPVSITNSAFDNTSISMDNPGANTSSDYNAFLTNAPETSVVGSHCITTMTNFNWESGFLGGNFYQPSNSPTIHAGSAPASSLGLYHFTPMTNLVSGLEIKEGTNIVSIGYLYVATDQYGNPIDTNGDGIPDYLEDLNGNGQVDSGEIGWNIVGDLGLSVTITRPKNNSVIP